MTGSGVERTRRAASRPAHVRFGLRVLAVGGLAGAAWLLSAASAHAAEASAPATDTPTDLSVVSLVEGVLTGTLAPVSPAPAPASAEAPASTVVLPSATAASATRIAAQPATRPDGDRGTDRDAGTSAPTRAAQPRDRSGSTDSGGVLAGTVRGLTAPLGLSGALAGPTGLLTPLTRAVDPVVAPLNGVLRPVTGVLLTAAQPVTATLGSLTRTVTGLVDPTGRRAPDLTPAPTPVPGTDGTPAENGPVSVLGEPMVRLAGVSTTSGDRRYAGTELRSADTPDERPGGGNLPDRHYPAPLRAYFGAGAGIPAGGPGSHPDGGGFATIPASVVERTVASHRLPVTTDVAALRHEAQAPTVSPD